MIRRFKTGSIVRILRENLGIPDNLFDEKVNAVILGTFGWAHTATYYDKGKYVPVYDVKVKAKDGRWFYRYSVPASVMKPVRVEYRLMSSKRKYPMPPRRMK